MADRHVLTNAPTAATRQTVLFLCTGNYYRSRFAELLFNAEAQRLGLLWQADSAGLSIRGPILGNVGPISCFTLAALEARELTPPPILRYPRRLTLWDLEHAARVIAVKEAEHRPLMERFFPQWASRIDYWHIHDLDVAGPDQALPQLQKQVEALIARLI